MNDHMLSDTPQKIVPKNCIFYTLSTLNAEISEECPQYKTIGVEGQN